MLPRTACVLALLTVVAPAGADDPAVSKAGAGSGRVIDYGGEDAARDAAPARPASPAARTETATTTRRVELITGGNSTDGAARVGVLPIED